ncbi:MAG TPA: orotidine-5'-phosphate decarboxylase [Burkholderiales bacterium]
MSRDPRIIVALDYATAAEAEAFVARVSPARCRLKVGLELYTAAGPAFVGGLVERGFSVFLDLKFHDIPNTVERACRQAAKLGVDLLTVHCLGGRRMLEAACAGVRGGESRTRLIGVTLLTSLGPEDTDEIGLGSDVGARTAALATLARAAGLDGVVCAPTEAQDLRTRFGPGWLLVTPGIRPAGSASGDQQRTLTPREAAARGADLLVIGRPITRAPDPMQALAEIERDLANV